jgi:hypothetical protein
MASLNTANFLAGIQSALNDNCVGYCMQLRQHGAVVQKQAMNSAQLGLNIQTPLGLEAIAPSLLWLYDTPMHICSLSKMFTAMAMTQVLNNAGVTPDTAISKYLPTYWAQGPAVSQITFANLMTHTSGLTSGSTDYESMKNAIAMGVTSTYGIYQYANMNFSLCRILLSVLNENITVGFDMGFGLPALTDFFWDFITISAFNQYVTANIFNPGNSAGHMVHQPDDALAYPFPGNFFESFNDGDLTVLSGAGGWHMSVDQVLDVMGTFRRGGANKIMSQAQAQNMLDNGFAVDWTMPTSAGGSYYAKNGFWPGTNGSAEQTVAFYLPEDMELVVFVNSPVNAPPQFLYSVISEIYLNNLM